MAALFESAEHVFLGNNIILNFFGGEQPALTKFLHLSSERQATYGRVIALAGDFFGPATGACTRW